MKKIFKKIDNRVLAIGSTVIFIISMLPIWYLAKYARPSGDDYGYSVLTHAAWLDTHSIWAVIRAGFATVKQMYNAWNGDWFTTFLFTLMPETFAPWTFWIVPFIMTGVLILGTSIFLYEVCVRILEMPKTTFVIVNCMVLFASFQYIPSTAIGMYWYVGAVHYIVPHMAALLAVVEAWRFFDRGKYRHLFWATVWCFVVGGSSYFSSLLVFMIYVALIICGFHKNKKAMWLLIPFFICFIGFVVQCKSPGNVVRGGESFGLNGAAVIETVITALWRGLVTIGSYFTEKTLVMILIVLIAMFGWEAMSCYKGKYKFRYPLLFVVFMYGCYSAQFAPEVYAAVEVSGGPATMVYLTFLLAAASSIFYVEGWVIQKYNLYFQTEERAQLWRNRILFPVIGVSMILVLLNPGWIKNSVDFRAYEYVESGRADDFKAQIESQMQILLDDSIKDAYLVPINDDQGPLMHMPVTENPDAFTNWVVKEFYRKNKVVMIK